MGTTIERTTEDALRFERDMARMHRGTLVRACERNAARMLEAVEVMNQPQPGMPALPKAWRDWMFQQAMATKMSLETAVAQVRPNEKGTVQN